jgi:hypothetical protein
MIYVITNPELGWDCVCGVYNADSEQQVAESYVEQTNLKEGQTAEEWMEEHNYIIHEISLIKLN